MELVKGKKLDPGNKEIAPAHQEITAADETRFLGIVSVDLSREQQKRVTVPVRTYPRQRSVLAVHWHPEFVPLELIGQRINALFPNLDQELIIPTQHNEITAYGDYSGVEVDCYSHGFKRKVQLLLHFETAKLSGADTLRSALAYTFQYRSSQLYDFIHTLTKPVEDRIERAARETGANQELVEYVRQHTAKIARLLDTFHDSVPRASIKNKLLRNYFDALRGEAGNDFINRVQVFLKAVKQQVKDNFPLKYFYRTTEIIEEARALGAGIVIPHPEQFWPILLADYDVDGYEVWNPQSREYTDFLISTIIKKNKQPGLGRRKLLVFMGDDTHMAEKVKPPGEQDKAKAAREIGVQPAWDDRSILKKLIIADMDRRKVIADYKSRLAG